MQRITTLVLIITLLTFEKAVAQYKIPPDSKYL